MAYSWKKQDIEDAINMFRSKSSVHEIARKLGIPVKIVTHKLRMLGYRASLIFSPQDDAWIQEYYATVPWNDLIQKFPQATSKQIVGRANTLGIKRYNPSAKQSHNAGMANRFEYGLTEKEWCNPPKKPPKDQSLFLHPVIKKWFFS